MQPATPVRLQFHREIVEHRQQLGGPVFGICFLQHRGPVGASARNPLFPIRRKIAGPHQIAFRDKKPAIMPEFICPEETSHIALSQVVATTFVDGCKTFLAVDAGNLLG